MRRILIVLLGLFSVVKLVSALDISSFDGGVEDVNFIRLSGKIEKGDSYRLKLFISKLSVKSGVLITLNSPGGNLYEGMKLGHFFHDNELATMIEENNECASSCAFAFLGGINKSTKTPFRVKATSGKLGFHTFYSHFEPDEVFSGEETSTLMRVSQLVILDLLEYFEKMDVSIKLLKDTLSTEGNAIYWLDNSEALEYGIHVYDENSDTIVDLERLNSILK